MMPEPSGADSRDEEAVSPNALRAGQRDEMRATFLTKTKARDVSAPGLA
ncbi:MULTISPECIES: hypothetical protein [unclassified Corallococcus]|nr:MULTISPECIES: hypothetical protein [unclassified Corallococcus]MBN9685775.1 hypothetical protein [Corallococcus sp. NCSPR001]WAS82781.1 hypothetical protein O0N60_26065 [Corallococcus sp. NCRR]